MSLFIVVSTLATFTLGFWARHVLQAEIEARFPPPRTTP